MTLKWKKCEVGEKAGAQSSETLNKELINIRYSQICKLKWDTL